MAFDKNIGINRDSINRDSMNCDSINRDSINRDGMNCDSMNRDGMNRDGMNRDGMNRRAFCGVLVAGACCMSAALAGCAANNATDNVTDSAKTAAGSVSDDGTLMTDTTVGQVPSSAKSHEQLSTTFFAFDTVVTLTASCTQELLDRVADKCSNFESIFSRTIDTSDIGRINAAKGAPVKVADETADLVSKALVYGKESGGTFDITIGAASTLWDFKKGVVPSKAALDEAVRHIDYTKVHVQGNTITLDDPDAKLDLGGIAKGYIADALAAFFIKQGCDSACINLGGNVKTVGLRPDGQPWHVGVQDPNDATGSIMGKTSLQDASCVTSGLYERHFEKGGKKYWHILDPTNGYPVKTDLVSATIISQASIDGDGYTKPLFMMNSASEAIDFLNGKEGLEGIVETSNGDIYETSGNPVELL